VTFKGQMGVLVRASKRVSAQTYRERELTVEMPQGEMIVGLEGDWINVEGLKVKGLQSIRVGKKRILLGGDRNVVGRFKGWLTYDGNVLERSDQPEKLKGKKGFGGYVGQVNTPNKKRSKQHISRIGGENHDGAVFMTPGGVMVEVRLGDFDYLKKVSMPIEKSRDSSPDMMAKKAIVEIERKRQEKKRGW